MEGFVTKTIAMFSHVCRIYIYVHRHTYMKAEGEYLEGEERSSRSAGETRETRGCCEESTDTHFS